MNLPRALKIDRQFFRSRIGIILIVISAVVLLSALMVSLRPLPSRHLAMATGQPGSAYEKAGQRYREILARDGVELRLVPTAGAVDNMRLLSDPHSGIEAGFVQSGSLDSIAAPKDLQSLGTVFYEAVWFFVRSPPPQRPLKEQVGWRLSIGPQGSADRPLAVKLLKLNGVDPNRFQFSALAPEESAKALREGRIDGLLLLSAWDSPVVQMLARDPGVSLLGFQRADAYVALDPTWTKSILPRGVADLGADRPPEDVPLIGSKASLAVRNDLHPALQYLLLQAAIEVHSRAGMFQHAGEFPAPEEIDLPLSNRARQIYRAGPSFLQRSLPFWLAELVQRLLILIIPIAGIIYPLWSLAPRIYAWQMKRRVSRMYVELKRVEYDLQARTVVPGDLAVRLDDLDARALGLKVPSSYSENIFNLKAHIRALRTRIEAQKPL